MSGNLEESLFKLVNGLVPASFEPAIKQDIYDQLVVFIRSKPQESRNNNNLTISDILNSFEKYFVNDIAGWNKFQRTVKVLLRYKSLDQVCKYLIFLNELQANDTNLYPYSKSTKSSARKAATNLTNLESPLHNSSSFSTSSNNNKTTQNDSMIQGRSSFGNDSRNSRLSEYGQPQRLLSISGNTEEKSSYKRHRSNLNENYSGMSMGEVVNDINQRLNENNIAEEDIVDFIFYALLGSSSKIFPINYEKGIQIHEFISKPNVGILSFILEASLLYQALSVACKVLPNKSHIKAAFLGCVKGFLNEYTGYVNKLSISENHRTLLAIYSSITKEIYKMRFINYLTNQVKEKDGYVLLVEIFSHTQFGDPTIRALSIDLFKDCSEPYYKTLQNWILNGELGDKTSEFFIDSTLVENGNHNIDTYLSGLKMDLLKYPSFLTNSINTYAWKISQIGKIIIYLRDVCKEYGFLNEFKMKYDINLASLDKNQLSLLIDSEYRELIDHLTILVFQTHKLDYHIDRLKDFFLLSKGDFIYALICKCSQMLDEPAQDLSTIQLSKSLSSAIQNSSCNTYKKNSLMGLDARITSVNNVSGSIGWDVFTLDYILEEPLRLIVYNNNIGLKNYLKLFNFLWRLRRYDFLLSKSWTNNNSFYKMNHRIIRNQRNLWMRVRQLSIYRSILQAFISKLFQYLNNKVIDAEYFDLMGKMQKSKEIFKLNNDKDLGKAMENSKKGKQRTSKLEGYISKLNNSVLPKQEYINKVNESAQKMTHIEPKSTNLEFDSFSIDEFIQMHEKYLSAIIKNKLLDTSLKNSVGVVSGKYYVIQIGALIDIISSFLKFEEEFYLLLSAYCRDSKNSDKARRIADMNQSEDMILTDVEQTADNLLKMTKIFKNITLLMEDYRESLNYFVKDLENDNSSSLQLFGRYIS